MNSIIPIFFLTSLALLSGCLHDQNNSTTDLPPVANAGIDQTVNDSTLITLDGNGSRDDQQIVSYNWEQISGKPVELSNNLIASPTFTAPLANETLTFTLTVTDSTGAVSTDNVDINISLIYEATTAINTIAHTPIEQANYDSNTVCTSYEANYHPFTVSNTLYEINAGAIAVIWGDTYDNLPADYVTSLTELQTDAAKRQNVIDSLVEMQRKLLEDNKIKSTSSKSAVDGKCYRINLYIKGTEVEPGDTVPSYSGGAVCRGDAAKEIPYLKVGPNTLISIAGNGAQPDHIMSHEYTHAIQCGVDRGAQTGWEWNTESIANYFGNDASNTTVALDQFHQNNFWAIDIFFTRYGVWPFWMFLSDKFGYEYTADIMLGQSNPDESLLEYMRRIAPVDCPSVDVQCRKDAFANIFAEFANSTANYVLYTNQENVDYRSNAISWWAGVPRASAHMQKTDANRYRISDWLAPQRFGFNIIELIPDETSDELKIKLDGWDIPERESQWRATLVATLDDTTVPPVEAYGEMFSNGTQAINLSRWETELGTTIKRLELVVAATPTNWKLSSEISGFTNPKRYDELDQYVYELTIEGAWPLGHEPDSLRDAPTESGAAHSNGGGFVASTATVANTAYVGPEARVLGNAQVLGNARIEGRAIVKENAIVQDSAIISSSVLMLNDSRAEGYATVRDNVWMRNTSKVMDDGKLQGDASVAYEHLISGKAVSLGTPLTETTGTLTLTGTAISNGHEWINSGTASMGTPYDGWTVDDNGLFLHYDFTEEHPYRIKDIHASSDAYYLSTDGRPSTAPIFTNDSVLTSNTLVLDGTGFLELPKWILDQRSYQLEMLLNWTGGSQTQYLLDADTARGERLSVQIVPVGSDGFDLKLIYTDRTTSTTEILLQDAIMQTGEWLKVAINYDDTTSTMKLIVNPVSGTPIKEASAIISIPTREFDYDTLSVNLGATQSRKQMLNARIDDVKLIR